MVKLRDIIIFNGKKTVSIVRAKPIEGDGRKTAHIKHRGWGFLKPFIAVANIPDYLISQSKEWYDSGNIKAGFNVHIVNYDLESGEPNFADLPAHLIAENQHLRTKVEMLEVKLREAKKQLFTVEGKDKFMEEYKRTAKKFQEIKNATWSPSGSDLLFGNRGMPPSGGE
jgi:hypothetical protein